MYTLFLFGDIFNHWHTVQNTKCFTFFVSGTLVSLFSTCLASSDLDSRSSSFGAIFVVAKWPNFRILFKSSWRWASSSLVPPFSFDNLSYLQKKKTKTWNKMLQIHRQNLFHWSQSIPWPCIGDNKTTVYWKSLTKFTTLEATFKDSSSSKLSLELSLGSTFGTDSTSAWKTSIEKLNFFYIT